MPFTDQYRIHTMPRHTHILLFSFSGSFCLLDPKIVF
uniref:Uncharacterized protein n=1 Tax=Arundo donax TaxID=35708 RepID=A0A0A9DKJ9_ARUDO